MGGLGDNGEEGGLKIGLVSVVSWWCWGRDCLE